MIIWRITYCYHATRAWGWSSRLYWEWASAWTEGMANGTWDADTTPEEAFLEDASNA